MTPKDIYKNHFPYIFNKVDEAHAFYRNGVLNINLLIKDENAITSGVIWKPEDPNPWVEKLLHRNNPGKTYLQNQIKKASKSGGKLVRIANKKYPIRWAGSGGMLVLTDKSGLRTTPLNLRPKDGFYPYHLDANGGLSSKRADWIYPQLLGLREIIEELLIVSENKIVIPKISQQYSDLNMDKMLDIKQLISFHKKIAERYLFKKFNLESKEIINITPEDKKSKIKVSYWGKNYISKGIILVDYETAAIDFRNIYEIKVPDIERIILIDGEADGKNKYKSRNRELALFTIKDIQGLKGKGYSKLTPCKIFKSGQSIEKRDFKISLSERKNHNTVTPVLKIMIDLL